MTSPEETPSDAPQSAGPDGAQRRVLLISEDHELSSQLHAALTAAGFRVSLETQAARGLKECMDGTHCLVVLDTATRGHGAVPTLRWIRARRLIPIVVLSPCRHREDLAELLEGGADDYVGGQIDPDEVVARIRALLRRSGGCVPVPERLEAGAIRIATASRLVRIAGAAVALTSVEYDILEYLARRAGRAVCRDELMAVVCRRQSSPLDRSLDVHVSHLRRKLRHHGRQIRTIRGVGYMLAASDPDSPEPM
jgi:two-component system response regulator CpxR